MTLSLTVNEDRLHHIMDDSHDLCIGNRVQHGDDPRPVRIHSVLPFFCSDTRSVLDDHRLAFGAAHALTAFVFA